MSTTEAAPATPKPRTPPTELEQDLKRVCDDYMTGAFAPGKPLTTQVLARQIHTNRGEVGNRPSSGAIADALKRWQDIGFAHVDERPLAFVKYTEAGETQGLSALKLEHTARKAAARAALRADKKATATTAAAPTPAPASSDRGVVDEGVPF